jgi:hypothetical protein
MLNNWFNVQRKPSGQFFFELLRWRFCKDGGTDRERLDDGAQMTYATWCPKPMKLKKLDRWCDAVRPRSRTRCLRRQIPQQEQHYSVPKSWMWSPRQWNSVCWIFLTNSMILAGAGRTTAFWGLLHDCRVVQVRCDLRWRSEEEGEEWVSVFGAWYSYEIPLWMHSGNLLRHWFRNRLKCHLL